MVGSVMYTSRHSADDENTTNKEERKGMIKGLVVVAIFLTVFLISVSMFMGIGFIVYKSEGAHEFCHPSNNRTSSSYPIYYPIYYPRH